VEISARHVHLSEQDLLALFGKGHSLTPQKILSQPGEFAAEEVLAIRYGDKEIKNVRVVSPLRRQTQVEIALTDAYTLGLAAQIRLSGDLKGTPSVLLIGPAGQVQLKEGVIVALRHLHVSSKEVADLGVKNNDVVSIKVSGERAVTFHNVKVRVGENYKTSLHLDTDEGNAAGIDKKTFGEII
jgi:putative phosphotransacetylase